jgi:DNA-binding CsgD family transcriptional regulator
VATLDETRLVGFMEAVFSLEIDDQHWLSQVLSALAALCGPDHHYRGFFYDASDVSHLKLWNACAPHTTPELEAAFALLEPLAEPELVTTMFRALPLGSWRHEGAPRLGSLLSELERSGVADLFQINGLDPSGLGCLLLIGCSERELSPSPSELLVYQRLATNLASAFRARRRLGAFAASSPHENSSESESHERFAQLVGAAREQLRSSPPVADATRTNGRRMCAASALDFSHPASKARLTLVHTFEESGRRYIVARENDVRSLGLAALTGREREIVEQATSGFTNKQIAYNLGISNATVRVLMARAAGRIGVRTRRELLAHPALEEMRRAAEPEQALAVGR